MGGICSVAHDLYVVALTVPEILCSQNCTVHWCGKFGALLGAVNLYCCVSLYCFIGLFSHLILYECESVCSTFLHWTLFPKLKTNVIFLISTYGQERAPKS